MRFPLSPALVTLTASSFILVIRTEYGLPSSPFRVVSIFTSQLSHRFNTCVWTKARQELFRYLLLSPSLNSHDNERDRRHWHAPPLTALRSFRTAEKLGQTREDLP